MYPLVMTKTRNGNGSENLPVTNEEKPLNLPLSQQTGKKALKYKQVGELASRGWTASMIAKSVGLSEIRILRILRREDVCKYVLEVISSKFQEGDKVLGWLYAKSMKMLDEDISSSNRDVREKAIDKVLKCYGYNQGEGKVPSIIQQIFTQGGPGIVQDIDALIIAKRLERGLPMEEEPVEVKPIIGPIEPLRTPKTDKTILREGEDDEEN